MDIKLPRTHFKRIRSFWFGLILPYRSAKLIITNKPLFFWASLPIALTFILYIYGISKLQEYATGLLQNHIIEWGFSPESLIGWSLMFLGKVFFWVVAALTFAFSSSIVASPFNDILAERSENYAYPPLPPVAKKTFKQQVHLIGIDLLKTIAAAFAAIIAIIFSWLPGFNIVAFIIAFLLVTFQYISYPQTRRGIGLREGVRFLWTHIYACTGFGAMLTFLFAVPFFSSFILPVAVTGGTLLAARATGTDNVYALK